MCKGSQVGSPAICLSIPHEPMTILFPHTSKFLSWKAKFTCETWAPGKPNPGKRAEGRQSPGHGFAQVLFPDLQLMLHKRAIPVIHFACADHLPRGHDLSVFLVPSSADVPDPVWNAHARNPGKQQPVRHSGSDLVVRWEPSARHHPSPRRPSLSHRGLRVRDLGETLVWRGALWQVEASFWECTWSHREHLECLGPCQGKLASLWRKELLTLPAEDPNGCFAFLSANAGDIFLKNGPFV